MQPAALEALTQYYFPGNVREMENILERAVTLCTDGKIDAADLHFGPNSPPWRPPRTVDTSLTGPLGETLEDIERDAIVKALEQTRCNKTRVAALLGMSFR